MRHFDAWVVRDPYSIWHYYATGRRWQDTVRNLIAERKICAPDANAGINGPDAPPIESFTSARPMAAQDNCSLLTRLPPEIRQMIWGYVFGADTLHLVQVKDKIRHVRCTHPAPSLTHHRHCCPLTPARWRVYDGRVPGHSDRLLYPHTHERLPENLSNAGAALLRTCRAIHAEAADLLYRAATFDVDDLYTFIAFASAVGPARLRAIRRLTVQWMPIWQPLTGQDHKGSIYAHTHSDALWTQFWACVAVLPALRELRLSIDLGRFTGTMHGGGAVVVAGQRLPLVLAEPWLLPLLHVRGLCDFELAVTARCDPAAKGVIEGDLCRDAGVLRDQLRAVMCAPVGTLLEDIKELGLDGLCTLEALRDESSARNARPLAITAA
ncbi:uncharacterized protein N7459_003649 [Penicillium hispanicum]|uniref:uncharacterized protein n=1 Tax=Penicillium hispanicum TaxID=1080232 RepID=UPI002540E11F|nr:uncharacterized protein N7459_003649 [Penicillium hispanicum]KAJ5587884.1 hypothetical protein N7459_003649 [Penicillium hispanicum]